MTQACTRRTLITWAAGLIFASSFRRAVARQPAADVPGLDEGMFTSNYYDHDVTWTDDWVPDLFNTEVVSADAFEHLELEDQKVAWNEGPTQVQFILERDAEDTTPADYVESIPDDYPQAQGMSPDARIFDRGSNSRGAWIVYGNPPAADGSNVGAATVKQFLLPEDSGDPLITIEINMVGPQVKKSIFRRIDEEITFDGDSIFVVEDLDTLWKPVREAY